MKLCSILMLNITINIIIATGFSANAVAKTEQKDYKQVALDKVANGSLLFKSAASKHFLQAPALKTHVDIEINGIVANVKVKQIFSNTSKDWQHAVYAFPLPDDAAINQLKITLADRVIIGEVQEKQQARKTFNKAKITGRKAALVEQHRPNMFTTQVANIPPNETIAVELNYFQQVAYQAGEFSLHFPMAITPRYQPSRLNNKAQSSLPELIYQARNASDLATELALQQQSSTHEERRLIDLKVDLFSGAELSQVDSINHSLISSQQGQGHYQLKLSNTEMDKDFTLVWRYKQQTLPRVVNFQQTYLDNNYGLLMVLPGLEKTKTTFKPKRELTFVLDTSGSMHGDSITQAKKAFKYALSSLNEHDSFQLIAFNSYPTKLYQTPVPATEKNKQHAWRFASQLKAKGGTEIKSALDLVLTKNKSGNEKLQQIVFLTDGAVGNEAEIFSAINKKIADKRLFTVGLGTAPNRYFMKKSAEIGRGSYQFISNHNELAKQMDLLFTKLSQPVLTDLNMQLDSPNAELVTSPNPIPDIYHNEPLFLSYQVTGNHSGSLLSGIYQGKPWSVNIESNSRSKSNFENNAEQDTLIAKPKWQETIPPIATLWARRKISDYYRHLMLNKDMQAKDNIIELGLRFHLVTPFTSLVAVEKAISRPSNQIAKTKQLKNNLPAGQKLPTTALNWRLQFYGAVCLLLMSVIALFLFSQTQQTQRVLSKRANNAQKENAQQ